MLHASSQPFTRSGRTVNAPVEAPDLGFVNVNDTILTADAWGDEYWEVREVIDWTVARSGDRGQRPDDLHLAPPRPNRSRRADRSDDGREGRTGGSQEADRRARGRAEDRAASRRPAQEGDQPKRRYAARAVPCPCHRRRGGRRAPADRTSSRSSRASSRTPTTNPGRSRSATQFVPPPGRAAPQSQPAVPVEGFARDCRRRISC